MSAASELRRLTVSHQREGECSYCDARFAKIAEAAYGPATDWACNCGCGECPVDCRCPGDIEPGKLCECENG